MRHFEIWPQDTEIAWNYGNISFSADYTCLSMKLAKKIPVGEAGEARLRLPNSQEDAPRGGTSK